MGARARAGAGRRALALELEGDGAGSLVDGWAARHDDGTLDVLLWNGTLDQSKAGGAPLLDREVRVALEGLPAGRYAASLARVDDLHSNLAARWAGETPWPTPDQLAALQAGDVLHDEPLGPLDAPAGRAELEVPLPMPGIARVRLRPL